MALDTSSDFGNPDPNKCGMQSRISRPASSTAIAVQCAVRGSDHTSACPPGFRHRAAASILPASHLIHWSRPPRSESHSRPMKLTAAGGAVISELGAKPSDLLQANGIIWVEGPSDCIYLNRWLDLFTEGRLQEGRDYQCAFYGGSLLA